MPAPGSRSPVGEAAVATDQLRPPIASMASHSPGTGVQPMAHAPVVSSPPALDSPPVAGGWSSALGRWWSVAARWSVVLGGPPLGDGGSPLAWTPLLWPVDGPRHSVVGGRWSLVARRWGMEARRWLVLVGGRPLPACGWPSAVARWPLAAGGRWSVVGGRRFGTPTVTDGPSALRAIWLSACARPDRATGSSNPSARKPPGRRSSTWTSPQCSTRRAALHAPWPYAFRPGP